MRRIAAALGWVAAVIGFESCARGAIKRRSRAWLLGYGALGLAAAATGPPPRTPIRPPRSRSRLMVGLSLSLCGYGVGRRMCGDVPTRPAEDDLWENALALGLVALVEEATWGDRVQPAVGAMACACLFAVKHPLIDGNWRRVPGLALFGFGVGLLRIESRTLARLVHLAANESGVLVGHVRGIDQF